MVAEDFPLHLPFGQLTLRNSSTASSIACRYQIEDVEISQHFQIDHNGYLTLKRRLDFELQQVYKTRISVRNFFATAASPASTNVALLTIRVVDQNDNEPKFTKETQNLRIRIDEKTRRGTRLATLEAEDTDREENARLSYSLLATGEDSLWTMFRVHSTNGVLYFERWQDEVLIRAIR